MQLTNTELFLKRQAYRLANVEKLTKQKSDWYLRNREALQEKTKLYRSKHKPQHAIMARSWTYLHLFKKTVNRLKFHAEGQSYCSAFELWSIWHKQRGLCSLSGRKLTRENCHIDHIHPASKGGTHTKENLRWVCKDANQAKHDLTDEDFWTLCLEVIEYNWGAISNGTN